MDEINYLKKQVTIIINLYNAQRHTDVIQKGKVLIKKYPNQILFYNATALSLSSIGKYEDALKILKQALGLQPNNIHVLNNLGLINFYMNNNKIAREYYEKVISLNSSFIDTLVNLANLSMKENKMEESKKNLYKALSLSNSPDKNEIINTGLAHFFQQTGDFKKSIEHFKIVKKINPNNLIADRDISVMHKYVSDNDEHLIEMQKKLQKTTNKTLIKRLSFALAKAHEDLKNYETSFNYLMKANEIADKEVNYNLKDDKKLFANIKDFFENFDDKNILPKSLRKILFIVGMPRSGTTLAEQIISSHKNVYGAGELNFLTDAIYKFILKDNEFLNRNINEVNYEDLRKIQKFYLEEINIFPQEKLYITDKAPLNFRWIGFIRLLFPNSKIIHCVREPMDICFSNYKNAFSANSLGFSYNLNNLGNFFNLYKDLTKFWDRMFKDEIYTLNYEKLINNQQSETKKLLEYCDLEWDEKCLKPHENKKNVATASIAQVRSPIYKTSIKKWQNYSNQLKKLNEIINS